MRFENPMYLSLLLLLPVWFMVWRRKLQRSTGAIIYSNTSLFRNIQPPRFNLLWAMRVLITLALALTVISLARPQIVTSIVESSTEGIDILLALDISTSMSAEDFTPLNRMNVAKKVVADFIRGRKSDRIGLVLFSAYSFIKCPLTLDYGVLLSLLEEVDLATPQDDGTAIGTAIISALNRLRTSSAKSKVIILLTDGVNNRGSVSPVDAAQISKLMGVRIYTVGIGSNAPARYMVQEPDGTKRYVTALVKIDEDSLKTIASITAGRYFRATDSNSLSEIYKQIGEMEKTKVSENRTLEYRDLYPGTLLLALCMIVTSILLSNYFILNIP